MTTPDLPAADELADENDTAGWDHDRDGSMADHGTDDDAVQTIDADDYLGGAR
jgi:hypothetical protein